MVATGTFSTFARRLIVIFNIVACVAAVHVIDGKKTEETVVDEDADPPLEAMLPHLTFTDEMKVGMFFDKLRIDHTLIVPKDILRSVSPWEPFVTQYSREYHVDPDLVRAIIYAESHGDPYRISRDGAVGLMQLMPATADFIGIDNVLDPEENIKGGVMYIAWLVKNYNDEESALWAWNAGPGKLERHQMPRETKNFIVKVLSVKTFLKDDGSNTI